MKNYQRQHPCFALCGLNCGLCPIHHMNNGCPGCGGGEGHQKCAIVTCSLQHGGVEYCFQCEQYPCEKYSSFAEYDSFLTHQTQSRDFERVREIGLDAYLDELREKVQILERLLAQYNDGRRKSFFCLAVNLLPLRDVRTVMEEIREQEADAMEMKEKSALAVRLFQAMAAERGVLLKLKKKPKEKK